MPAAADALESARYRGRGLDLDDARLIVAATGGIALPRDWSGAIARQQTAIDILAPRMKHPRFDANGLFDRRFETLESGDGAVQARQDQTPPATAVR